MALLTFLIMQNDLNDVGTESVANSFCHSKVFLVVAYLSIIWLKSKLK